MAGLLDRFIPCQRRHFNRRLIRAVVIFSLVTSAVNVIANGANVYFHRLSRIDRADLHEQQAMTENLRAEAERRSDMSKEAYKARGVNQQIMLGAAKRARLFTTAEENQIRDLWAISDYDPAKNIFEPK